MRERWGAVPVGLTGEELGEVAPFMEGNTGLSEDVEEVAVVMVDGAHDGEVDRVGLRALLGPRTARAMASNGVRAKLPLRTVVGPFQSGVRDERHQLRQMTKDPPLELRHACVPRECLVLRERLQVTLDRPRVPLRRLGTLLGRDGAAVETRQSIVKAHRFSGLGLPLHKLSRGATEVPPAHRVGDPRERPVDRVEVRVQRPGEPRQQPLRHLLAPRAVGLVDHHVGRHHQPQVARRAVDPVRALVAPRHRGLRDLRFERLVPRREHLGTAMQDLLDACARERQALAREELPGLTQGQPELGLALDDLGLGAHADLGVGSEAVRQRCQHGRLAVAAASLAAPVADDLRAGGDELLDELLAGLLAGRIDDAAARADRGRRHHDVAIGDRWSRTTAALVTLVPTGTPPLGLCLVARLLRDLAARPNAMAALPRLDHLAQLADRALQLGDPSVALTQRLLQLGDAFGVGHLARRAPLAAKNQDPRAFPSDGLLNTRTSRRLIELNRYAGSRVLSCVLS